MKLAIIRRKFNQHGGAELFINRLANDVAESNIDISVITESWKNSNKNIHILPTVQHKYLRYQQRLDFIKQASHQLELNQFDIIQSHERYEHADIFRLGDGLHQFWLKQLQNESGTLKRIWLKFDPYHQHVIQTEHKMAANKDLTFVANSELIKNHLQDIYDLPDDRVEIISNGIDMSYFDKPYDSLDTIKKKVGIDSDLPIVTFVGSGYQRKGAFKLIEAIATESKFQAIIVGKDHQLNKAHKIVNQRNLSHRIKVLGPRDDVLDILKITDVFCLPSLYDSFSNSALEAICMGIPVVATEFVGLGSEIFKVQAGVQCTRDIDSIRESIKKAYANQKVMSQNALILSKNYDIKQITPSWLNLYKKISDRK